MPCLHDEVYAYLDVDAPRSFVAGGGMVPLRPRARPCSPYRPCHPSAQRDRCGDGRARGYDPDEFHPEYGIDSPFVPVPRAPGGGQGLAVAHGRFRADASPGQNCDRRGGPPCVPPQLRGRSNRRRAASAWSSATTPLRGRWPTCSRASWRATRAQSWRPGWRAPGAGPQGQRRRRVALCAQPRGFNFSGSRDLTERLANSSPTPPWPPIWPTGAVLRARELPVGGIPDRSSRSGIPEVLALVSACRGAN